MKCSIIKVTNTYSVEKVIFNCKWQTPLNPLLHAWCKYTIDIRCGSFAGASAPFSHFNLSLKYLTTPNNLLWISSVIYVLWYIYILNFKNKEFAAILFSSLVVHFIGVEWMLCAFNVRCQSIPEYRKYAVFPILYFFFKKRKYLYFIYKSVYWQMRNL